MILSKTSEYAIRVLGLLAKSGGRTVGAAEAGAAAGVPAAYAAKIFQGMARAGILDSERGREGGYRFRKNPAAVSLYDIVRATDDLPGSPLAGCVMGFKRCSDKLPCALHPVWAAAREKMRAALRRTSILEASRSLSRKTLTRKKFGGLGKSIRSVFQHS